MEREGERGKERGRGRDGERERERERHISCIKINFTCRIALTHIFP